MCIRDSFGGVVGKGEIVFAAAHEIGDFLTVRVHRFVAPAGVFVFGDGEGGAVFEVLGDCLLYTSPSPRDRTRSRMPSSA